MKNITRITLCKNCDKLLYIRNFCSICTVNFQNMRPRKMKGEIERMNKNRMNGFDFNNKCEMCGMDSEIKYEGDIEQQFCIDCLKEKR